MALKRVIEPSSGRVLIDGVDIASVRLFDLRSRLALVPQVRASVLGSFAVCHLSDCRACVSSVFASYVTRAARPSHLCWPTSRGTTACCTAAAVALV